MIFIPKHVTMLLTIRRIMMSETTGRQHEGDTTVADVIRGHVAHRAIQLALEQSRLKILRLQREAASDNFPPDALPPEGMVFAVFSRERKPSEPQIIGGEYEPESRGMVDPQILGAEALQGPYLVERMVMTQSGILAVGIDGSCRSFEPEQRDTIEFTAAQEQVTATQ